MKLRVLDLATNLSRRTMEVVASVAALASLVLLITVPINTYAYEGAELSDLIVVFALAMVGYLSPKAFFRRLSVVIALGTWCEFYSPYRRYLPH